MAIDDLVNKGKQFLEENKDKLDELIHSDKAEQASDSALAAAAELFKKLAPDEHDAKIDEVRANIDRSVGNE